MASKKQIQLVLLLIHIIAMTRARVYVMLPNNITEVFDSQIASFGPSIEPELTGKLAYPWPNNGCNAVTKAPDDRSFWFAIVDRGDCNFDLKVLNCQEANYRAVIVANSKDSIESMGAGNVARSVIISSVMVSRSAGLYLKEKVAGNSSDLVILTQEPISFSWDAYLIPFCAIVGLCILLTVTFLIVRIVGHRRHVRRWRLPKANLRKIPTKRFKKGVDTEESCAICLDEYKNGEKMRVLPCHHAYHSKCVDPWLTKSKRQCPVCKRHILDDGTCKETSGNQSSSDVETSFGSLSLSGEEQPGSGEGQGETTPLIGSPVRGYSGRGPSLEMGEEKKEEEEEDGHHGEEGRGSLDTIC